MKEGWDGIGLGRSDGYGLGVEGYGLGDHMDDGYGIG